MKKEYKIYWYCIIVLFYGYLLVSCTSFKTQYTDEYIYAELEVEDSDYVILYFKNNTESIIRIISDNCFYSNNGYSSILLPLDERFMVAGTTVPPINIPPNKYLSQKFVASSAIEYDKGKVNNINNWTPRDENKIKDAYFSFEYEINKVTKQLVFEGNNFTKR